MEAVLILLLLLQIKHWYIDFVDQNDEEVKHKGIYLDWRGVKHSLKQGVGTFFMFAVLITIFGERVVPYIPFILVLSAFDFIAHYHIDWCKMNYGNRDITTPAFWNHLGLDQMAHQIVYIIIAYFVIV
jgi:Protein of unknown function (DUF3307)